MAQQNLDQMPVPFTSANAAQGLTITVHDRELHMYRVTADELETLSSAGNLKTLDIALFSICIGAFLTVWSVIESVDTLTAKALASFSSI
jgi:hypothetical protein